MNAYLTASNPSNLPPEQLAEVEQNAFRSGVKACSPTLIGIAAWGLVVGVAMIKTHFTIMQALGMTLFVFAGSAQLAALPLIAVGAPVWVIFVTGLVVNLRFVIFSVILAPHFAHLSFRQRAFWGYMTGDVSMVYFMQRYPTEQAEAGKFAYLKGLLIPNWAAWQIGSIAGIFLGSQIPEEWGVGFAGSLAILCILLPMVMNRSTLIGVIVAGAIALLTIHWPYKLGMLLAVLIGMAAAMIWEEWHEKSSADKKQNQGTNKGNS
ncbi:AzlC family ABC transporter permease [Solimicrobium silvestre]|uniref:Putative branched-chain amino acid permease (Azaleucine resistance) n=1 Tax=Solimicrobium silvestre TaxID=2099400 RepID=A0A2S9GXG6_9BURK|nr:AzlC family ABC transporter permease [Solimicrobium silvestre]PRC92400.1 putative branched-chain amino acid permease (azaleucine resistance) [Solimicrobium silvestre]